MPTYKLKEGTPQYGFATSRNKIQMMGGGFGNGKTAALCIKALGLAMDYPGSNGLLARHTYKDTRSLFCRILWHSLRFKEVHRGGHYGHV